MTRQERVLAELDARRGELERLEQQVNGVAQARDEHACVRRR